MDPANFTTNVWNFMVMVVESAIFAYCVWKVPNKLSGMVPVAALMSFGEAIASGAKSGGGGALSAGKSIAGSAISAAGPAGSAAAHGAQALGQQAMALAQKVQRKLTS